LAPERGIVDMSMFKREGGGFDQAEAGVEGEIRDFVRRDVAGLRRPAAKSGSPELGSASGPSSSADLGQARGSSSADLGQARGPMPEGKLVADNLSSLLQRVSVSSVQEIDRLIADLKALRERLQQEGERVQREIVEYASLSQTAMQSTKIIADSLHQWKKVPDAPSISD
jgi:hypothetical protein